MASTLLSLSITPNGTTAFSQRLDFLVRKSPSKLISLYSPSSISTIDEASPLQSESLRACKGCGKEEIQNGCNGEGRIQGGIATFPGFGWWPIRAYRPCPGFVESGGRYRRQGQTMDEVAFGRATKNSSKDTKSSDAQSSKQIIGVEKEILRPGTGRKPVVSQNVTVHCTGYGKDGDLSKKFWSTKDAGQKPFTFQIGKGSVIKGWDEGILDMQLGEVARLRCSPDYAYGADGFQEWGILPNSVLDFEIELLKARKKEQSSKEVES